VHRRKRIPSKLDEFKPLIDQWLAAEPRLSATRIHQDLVRDYGFCGSYNTVRRFARSLAPRTWSSGPRGHRPRRVLQLRGPPLVGAQSFENHFCWVA
jgi:transposase